MYADLKGKTVLITGAGRRDGIGFAIAGKLAAEGCALVLADLWPVNGKELEDIAVELKREHGVDVLPVDLDVTSPESVGTMAGRLRTSGLHVHVLVNNAGAALGVPSAVHTYDDDAWMKTFDINFHGTYRVSKAVLPLMFGQEGVILNMASKAGKSPIAFNGAYGCAKAAVIALTKVMARELAGFGIRVNALCPGLIMTGLQRWRLDLEAQWFQTTPGEREKERSREIPLGYFAEPRVVADLAAFLASRESSYITGQAVNVDGGQLMEI